MTATPNPDLRRRTIDNWTTVAVTALPPGWRNVYRLDDGSVVTDQCPAILLQEHRSRTLCTDVPTGDGKYDVHRREEELDPPYETRAVYATDDECGGLDPAMDVSNYAGVAAPSEDTNRFERPAPLPTAEDPWAADPPSEGDPSR